jgi:hypothetical protein
MQRTQKIMAGLSALAMLPMLALAPVASAASTTVTVMGNTSAGENQPGWMFNRDASTSTPFEFNTDTASIGAGSLYVKPIGANANDKMIAEDFQKTAVTDLHSFSYDFKIAGNGTAASANQFYLNVYANIDNSNKFYDCRFDYVPTTGSTTDFTTFSVTPATVPTNVQRSSSARVASCPTTLAGMPTGSYVRVFAINVGDQSTGDTGLAGYLDNVVVNAASDVTTYDFEPATTPVNKDECKKDGWKTFNSPEFKNQGQCVSYVASHGKSMGNPVINFLLGLF